MVLKNADVSCSRFLWHQLMEQLLSWLTLCMFDLHNWPQQQLALLCCIIQFLCLLYLSLVLVSSSNDAVPIHRMTHNSVMYMIFHCITKCCGFIMKCTIQFYWVLYLKQSISLLNHCTLFQLQIQRPKLPSPRRSRQVSIFVCVCVC